jgi:DNA-binding transcriptional ArsR family regulator
MQARDNVAAAGSLQHDTDQLSYDVAADVLGMLADPTRLRLLTLLCEREADVSELTAQVPASRSSVSQHLGRLRLAGLVAAHRQGRRMVYRITSDHLCGLVAQTLEFAGHIVTGAPHHRHGGGN